MTTKRCSKCRVEQPLAAFGMDRSRPSGLNPWCRGCKLASSRARRGVTPDRFFANAKQYESGAEKQRAWRAANPERNRATVARADREKAKAACRRWRARNVEAMRARSAAWAKENPAAAALSAATRRARQRRACPSWADPDAIRSIYALASIAKKCTGFPFVVDHMVPIAGRTVTGLHVEHNLSVILDGANAVKGNRSWPDMP